MSQHLPVSSETHTGSIAALPSASCSILLHTMQALLCGRKCHSPFRPTVSSNSSGWHCGAGHATHASSLVAGVVRTTEQGTEAPLLHLLLFPAKQAHPDVCL